MPSAPAAWSLAFPDVLPTAADTLVTRSAIPIQFDVMFKHLLRFGVRLKSHDASRRPTPIRQLQNVRPRICADVEANVTVSNAHSEELGCSLLIFIPEPTPLAGIYSILDPIDDPGQALPVNQIQQ